MRGEPRHVDCGERTERVIGTMTITKTAPGVWREPAVWHLPRVLRFRCPVHGLVTWDQTRYRKPEATW